MSPNEKGIIFVKIDYLLMYYLRLFIIIYFVLIFDAVYAQGGFTRPNDWKKYRKEVVFQVGASIFFNSSTMCLVQDLTSTCMILAANSPGSTTNIFLPVLHQGLGNFTKFSNLSAGATN